MSADLLDIALINLQEAGQNQELGDGSLYTKLKVNALLDDFSTKTYLNADVAAELGLQGQTEKVTVNVLNDQVETFETKPVNFKLESLDGNVSMNLAHIQQTRSPEG